MIHLGWGPWPFGCLLIRVSLTVGESDIAGSTASSKCRILPSESLVSRFRAALHLPANIRLANERAEDSLDLEEDP